MLIFCEGIELNVLGLFELAQIGSSKFSHGMLEISLKIITISITLLNSVQNLGWLKSACQTESTYLLKIIN